MLEYRDQGYIQTWLLYTKPGTRIHFLTRAPLLNSAEPDPVIKPIEG
jgi:hypothetical protein